MSNNDYRDRIEFRFLNDDVTFDIKQAAMNTIHKKCEPSDVSIMSPKTYFKYLISEHSPIRSATLRITFTDMYYPTSVHFARHVHSIPYVTTSREDRTGVPRSLDNPVNHMMDINIQALIDMSRKRLCIGSCSSDTFYWMLSLKMKLMEHEDFRYNVLGSVLVPNCVYRSGCPEFKPCNIYNSCLSETMESRYATYNALITNFFNKRT